MSIELILLKDLPYCPKGRIFKQDINGNFFHSMTDEEGLSGKFKGYHFTKKDVGYMPEYFMLKDKAESDLSNLLSLSEMEEELKAERVEEKEKPFFMVLVENRSAPTKKYEEHKDAYEEAVRLSKKENQKAYVLKACTEIEQVPSVKHFY